MRNKELKSIIKIYFLIEKSEYNRCWNHTLHWPLLSDNPENEGSPCFRGCSVWPEGLGWLGRAGASWTTLPEGGTHPPHLQTASASASAFRWNVHRSSKLLTLTQPFTKPYWQRSLRTLGGAPITSEFGPKQQQPPTCGQRAHRTGNRNLRVLMRRMKMWG